MPDPSLIFTRPIDAGPRPVDAETDQNCSVEMLGLAIYGDYRHGWQLPCIDAGCQAAVAGVQDRLDDETRNSRRWRLLVARLATCHSTGNEQLERRMALWAARSVEHLSDDPRVKVCNDVHERWLAGEATDAELATSWDAARASAMAAEEMGAWTEAVAAMAAEDAARMDNLGAAAAAIVPDEDLADWVDRLLDEWGKVAADEGCMAPEDQDAEYLEFVSKLDFLMSGVTA